MSDLSDKRAPYHHGDLRNVLIAAGREMLEADGLRGFSLRALSRKARVSHAAPVHHFKTLSAFLAECRSDGFRELSDALEAAKAGASPSPTDILCHMAIAYLKFGVAYPVMLRVMFDKDTAPPKSHDPTSQSRRAYLLLEEAVRATLPDVTQRAPEFDVRINAVWSLIHGFVILHNEDQICTQSDPPMTTGHMLVTALSALLGSKYPKDLEGTL
ncbi:TetR/AcrR family transcriptional regulator [Litoreibacter roseus]|uniref:TetR/AcrR family transcriptional regulator n=1 Tax=Litoreibacter roseus TaxID=2601869 RepID=UPI0013571754|nr:TetR-like C-terminal domain-containing protein [Litoreibacter roseus]